MDFFAKFFKGNPKVSQKSADSILGFDGGADLMDIAGNIQQENVGEKDVEKSASARNSKLKNFSSNWIFKRFNSPAATGLVFAGFWYRCLAAMIDFILSLSWALAIVSMVQMIIPKSFSPIETVGGNTILLILAQMMYFIVFERSGWKATPGKRLLKLRVTDLRGQKITWSKSFIRTLAKMLIPFTAGGVLVWIFFTAKHQALYDKLCGTLVLRKSNESFLPKFLPEVIKSQHLLIVVALALMTASVSMNLMGKVAGPRAEFLAMRMVTTKAVKELEGAQKFVESAVLSNGKFPEKIEGDVFSKGNEFRFGYQSQNGSLSVIFKAGNFKDKGFLLKPMVNKLDSRNEIIWECAGINIPAEVSPDICRNDNGKK